MVVKNHFHRLAIPVDFNKEFRGKPILGKNKTFRGIIFSIIFAILIVLLQTYLYRYNYFKNLSVINYSITNPIILGFLIGFGASAGDMIKSFFKRRMGIEPGKRFIPWDQIDSVLGGLLLVYPYYHIPINVMLTTVFLTFFIHIGVRHLVYYLGIENKKW